MRYLRPENMAKTANADRDPVIEHAVEVDNKWSPKMLTVLGVITLICAISLIVFMATRLQTCMYLDGSQ